MNNAVETKRKLQVFRAAEALDVDSDIMIAAGVTATIGEGLQKAAEAGVGEGTVLRHLFSDPVSGLSLIYAWLKSNFQLPIHSHDADCVYYVISGEAHLGNDVLKAGDGFFVPKGARYSYRAGANGVEILEFRNATHFNIDFTGSGPNMFERIVAVSRENIAHWRTQAPPEAVQRFSQDGGEWIGKQ